MISELPSFKSFFNNISEGTVYCKMLFDAQGHPVDFIYLAINKNFEKLTGLKDVVGKKVTELIPDIKNSNPEMFEIYSRVSLSNQSENFEIFIKQLHKRFSVSVYSPKKKFFVALYQDITKHHEQHRQVEENLENAKIAARNVLEDLQVEKEKLAETTAKDEAILASIADGCIAVNEKGEIILINRMAQKILGYTGKESIGKQWYEILHREDEDGNLIPPEKGAIHAALSATTTTTTSAISFYYLRKNGTRFPVSRTVSPITLQGKIIGAINIFRDITSEKELDRAKSEFISIASHQLRTPVSGLSWLTEALLSTVQNLNPKQKTYVRDLSVLSKRMVGLVEDLLNISRIELKAPITMEKDLIKIGDFIEAFIKEIEPYANLKKRAVVFNKKVTEPISIEINKRSLYNVLQNLVSNAIDYSPENTTVTVDLEKMGSTSSPQASGFVRISIYNKGPVIPKEEQKRLFQKFFRGESVKKMKAEGTGLGLYIAKTIIEAVGGSIGFKSPVRFADGREGKDTVFWFTLKLKK